MDERLDAMLSEMLLQCFAVLTEDGEVMIDIVSIWYATGQCDQRVLDVFVIVSSQLLTLSIVCIEIFQLYAEDGCIYLRHATIDACVFEHVFPLTAVVGQSPNDSC